MLVGFDWHWWYLALVAFGTGGVRCFTGSVWCWWHLLFVLVALTLVLFGVGAGGVWCFAGSADAGDVDTGGVWCVVDDVA